MVNPAPPRRWRGGFGEEPFGTRLPFLPDPFQRVGTGPAFSLAPARDSSARDPEATAEGTDGASSWGGVKIMPASDGRLSGSIEVAKELGISLRQLYYWVDVWHVVEPQRRLHGRRTFRRFSTKDLRRLRQMRDLVAWGYTLQAAVGIVKGHREPR